MKKLKLLKGILCRTNTDKIIISYLVFLMIDALVILIAEPDINRYFDALWYCYEVISTTGFGELTAVTFIGRAGSVLLTIYSVIIIAVVTGVITNFYMQLIKLRQENSLESIVNKLETLPEMTKDELIELSEKVKKFNQSRCND